MITKAFMGARVIAAVAEARIDEARKCAADVCAECAAGIEAQRFSERHPAWFYHRAMDGVLDKCHASAIHERLSLKGGERKES